VLAIEERFGVRFEPEEMEEMKNVGAAAALVDKKLQSAARSS
jgi:acyl carrier protein